LEHVSISQGTWNVRSLYKSGSLTAAARELARYKLDVVGVQEVKWDKHCKSRGLYFFLWKKKKKSSIGNRMFCAPPNSISS
jgi:exonuclease III